MKYIFIMNELAGKGKCKTLVPKIEKACKLKNLEYEIKYITKEQSGDSIVREYKDEENIIYAVGGDGTLTKILAGIVGTKNKLGIIPAGSGNDTYKTVKTLPKGENLIDLGKINDTYFINTACIGLDAEVANNIDVLRNTIIPASQLYHASIIYTFIKYKFKKIKIKMPVKKIEANYTILSICNGSYYGGGFKIAPKSKITDGLLDVYYAEKMSKMSIIPLILKLKKGKHEGKRKVHKYRTNHIEIDLEETITFNVDGEKLTDNKFIIDVIPKAITVFNDNELVNMVLSGEITKQENYVLNDV